LVDDGSVDNTSVIVQKYILDKTIDFYVKNENNKGVSEARNVGINYCRDTDFIIFLDSDDQLSREAPNILNKLEESDVVLFDFTVVENGVSKCISHNVSNDASGIITHDELMRYLKEYLIVPNKKYLWCPVWGKVFKTSIIVNNAIRFNAKMKLFEDADFNFKFLKYATKIRYIKNNFYIHYFPSGKKLFNTATMGEHATIEDKFSFIRALMSLRSFMKMSETREMLNPLVYHCIGVYCIITLIRVSLRMNSIRSFIHTYRRIRRIFQSSIIKTGLKYYDVVKAKGGKVIPYLLKKDLYLLALIYSYYIGRKRYFSSTPK
jgi:glycosyltransferase involved in cell wall biosynthesis